MAFTEEAQQGLNQASSSTLPILEDGSYVLAPMQLESGQTKLRLECCLAGDAQGQLAPRTRTRVVHLLKRAQEGQPWQLDAIEVCFLVSACMLLLPEQFHHGTNVNLNAQLCKCALTLWHGPTADNSIQALALSHACSSNLQA